MGMARNPFLQRTLDGRLTGAVDVESRKDMVKRFDLDQCNDALGLTDNYGPVRKAVVARMRVLKSEAAKR